MALSDRHDGGSSGIPGKFDGSMYEERGFKVEVPADAEGGVSLLGPAAYFCVTGAVLQRGDLIVAIEGRSHGRDLLLSLPPEAKAILGGFQKGDMVYYTAQAHRGTWHDPR